MTWNKYASHDADVRLLQTDDKKTKLLRSSALFRGPVLRTCKDGTIAKSESELVRVLVSSP